MERLGGIFSYDNIIKLLAGITVFQYSIKFGKGVYRICNKKTKEPNDNTKKIIINTNKDSKRSFVMDLILPSESNFSSINKGVYQQFLKDYQSFAIDDDFELEISTCGGDVFYCFLITNYLYNHRGKITCIIKDYAMSGGSLLALGCDKIQMGKNDVMGPVDPQLFGLLPVKDIIALLTKKEDRTTLEGLLLSTSEGVMNGYLPRLKKILSKNHSEETVEKIINNFLFSDRDHSSIFTYEDLTFLENLELIETN